MNPTDQPPRLILRDPTRDPREDEEACREAIVRAQWFDALDREPAFPVDTATAEPLLRDGGLFAVPEGELMRLVSHGLLPKPVEDVDGPEWSACDLLKAVQLLEYRRQWLHDTPHDAKRLDQERILEAARRDGDVDTITAPRVGTVDPLHVLMNMVHLESREARLMNPVILRLLLEHLHKVKI